MRILVISDIHGNYDALRAVLESATNYDEIWLLGDYVDYGPEPHLVVDTVKDLHPGIVLMGNHDYAVAYNTDCRCMNETRELSHYTRTNISFRLLGKDHIYWLRSLPLHKEIEISGRRLLAVHGSPRSPLYGYLRPSDPPQILEYMLVDNRGLDPTKYMDYNALVVGHSHVPFRLRHRGIEIYNPGSCGQPRDGDNRASFAIYDTDENDFQIYRVKYDIESVLRKLRGLGIESKYYYILAGILVNGKVIHSSS